MRALHAVWGLVVAVGPWGIALGCSCSSGSLEQRYQGAANILIVEITGCTSAKLLRHGQCDSHGWLFNTIEDLKGSNAKVRRLPSDDDVGSSCDVSLEVGEKYLLYLYEGRTALCGGTKRLSEGGSNEADVLRAYRDKRISTVTQPWYFSDRSGSCTIFHEMDGASIRFEYLYNVSEDLSLPPGQKLPSKPVPVMLLESNEPFAFVGQPLLQIGADSVALTRVRTGQEGQEEDLDVVPGDRALEALEKLSRGGDVTISGTRSPGVGASEPFRATTSSLPAASAIAGFRACLVAHPVYEDR